MKYLKRFNESKSDDFADYLYSLFEVDPDEVLQGEDWYFGRWYWNDELNLRVKPELANLDQLLKSNKRFSDFITIVSVSVDIDILIVTPEYYKQNSQWLVSNLKWERHPLAVELDKNPELKKLTSMTKIISDKAAIVKDLPNNCTLIKGMRFGDGLEFWPQNYLGEPIYVETDVELQALIYKYICDEKTNEGLFNIFKSSNNYYKASQFNWKKINISGIDVNLQPGVTIEKSILDPVIEKIKKMAQEWFLLGNDCVVYRKKIKYKTRVGSMTIKLSDSSHIKFRVSDCEGDNKWGTESQIPEDIKSEIISDFYKLFGKNGVEVDEFPERGYLIFDVCIKL